MNEAKTLRAFVALELPETVKQALTPSVTALERQYPEMKWVEPRNLHLTLKFLGETTASARRGVGRLLAEVARQGHPFRLGFAEVGRFGDPNQPQLLWLGLQVNSELIDLARQVEMGCRRLGIAPEYRPFRPHITLARARSQEAVYLAKRPVIPTIADLPDWQVRSIALITSELTPRGPIYTKLDEWVLGG